VISLRNRSPGAVPAAKPFDLREVRRRQGSSAFKAALLMIGLAFLAVVSAMLIVVTGWLSLAVVLVLVLCGLLLWDFRIGAVALMVFLPLAGIRFLPSFKGLNAQNLLLFGTLLSYGLLRMMHKVEYRVIDKRLVLAYLLPFLVAGFIGSGHAHAIAALALKSSDAGAVSGRGGFLLYYVIKPGLLIVMAWLIAAAVRQAKDHRRFLTAFTFGAIVPALFIAIYLPLSGVSLTQLVNFRSFFSVLGMHSNQLAVALNFGFACLLFAGIEAQTTGRRIFLLGSAAFVAATLVLTFSRGGYLGLALILAAYVVHYREGGKLLIGLLVLGIAAFFVPDAVVERVTLGITHGSRADLSSGRIDDLWLPLLPKVLESPVFGHGLLYVGRSDLVTGGRMMAAAQAHNAYLDLLLDAGLIGLLLVTWFLSTVFRDFRRLSHEDPDPVMRGFFRGAAVGLLSWLLQAFFDDRLFPNQPQVMFWMAYGIMLGRDARLIKGWRPLKAAARAPLKPYSHRIAPVRSLPR
jgi:O-antigen ligase